MTDGNKDPGGTTIEPQDLVEERRLLRAVVAAARLFEDAQGKWDASSVEWGVARNAPRRAINALDVRFCPMCGPGCYR